MRNLLRASSGTIFRMPKQTKAPSRLADPRKRRLASAFATSLRYFMGDRTPNDVGVKLGKSPNTIRNWLRLSDPTEHNSGNFPQIDTLDAVAKELDCEVWELLHPDIEQLQSDLALISKTKALYLQPPEPREQKPLVQGSDEENFGSRPLVTQKRGTAK